jgi:hypothetical protein
LVLVEHIMDKHNPGGLVSAADFLGIRLSLLICNRGSINNWVRSGRESQRSLACGDLRKN